MTVALITNNIILQKKPPANYTDYLACILSFLDGASDGKQWM